MKTLVMKIKTMVIACALLAGCADTGTYAPIIPPTTMEDRVEEAERQARQAQNDAEDANRKAEDLQRTMEDDQRKAKEQAEDQQRKIDAAAAAAEEARQKEFDRELGL